MTEQNHPSTQLNGWKDIAAFFGKSPRTVQRWEAKLRLPVHRLRSEAGDAVYAFVHELEAWREERTRLGDDPTAAEESPADNENSVTDVRRDEPAPNAVPTHAVSRQRRTSTAVGGAALLLTLLVVGLTVGWYVLRVSPVASAAFTETGIAAKDAKGRAVWAYAPGHTLARRDHARIPRSRILESRPRVVDLDGDGRPEVLAVVGREVPGLLIPEQTLLCLSDRGEVRWAFKPDITRRFGDTLYGPPWFMTDMAVTGTGPDTAVWLAVVHQVHWPSFLFRLSADGSAIVAMVNAGHIFAIEPLEPDARATPTVLAAGVNNEWASAMVTAVGAKAAPLLSPQTAGGPFACVDCTGVTAGEYALLKRSEFNGADPFLPYNWAFDIFRDNDRFVVNTLESEVHSVLAMYRLESGGVGVADFSLTDGAAKAHANLEAEGRIDHRWADCPTRRRAEVSYWIGHGRWRSAGVPAR